MYLSDLEKEQNQKQEIFNDLLLKIGTENEHLPFRDVLSISESMVELIVEAQQIIDRSDNNDET